ncbi:MAG TPA: protein-disulfide reductase DsbD domain-containing protein [Alphaproteobacteria bacterium]
MFKIIAFLAVFLLSLPAIALESPWVTADYVQAKLSSGIEGVGEEPAFDGLLEIRLGRGWHAYWRMPGEGGLPPVFDWNGSVNLKNAAIEWPLPQRFVTDGITSFGYNGNISFPLTITPEKPGEKVSLNLKASIMVCNEICVPQDVILMLDIPPGKAAQSRTKAMIEHARASVPNKGDLPSQKIESVVLGPDAMVVHVFSLRGLELETDLFVEAGDIYITAKPEIMPDEKDPRGAMLKIVKPEGMENMATALAGRIVTLTFTDGQQAIEKSFPF